MGSRSPMGRAILGEVAPIVMFRDFLSWAVQKWLNRSIFHLGCGLAWAKGSTSSIVFARLHQCACRHSVVSCAKVAEPIDLPFGSWTRVGWSKHKFSRIYQVVPMCLRWRVHWRHLANTIEPSVCCGDTAWCQITLTTCFFTARCSSASAVLGVVILSVRPSVRLSHACFVTNPKNLPAIFLCHMTGQFF